MNGVLVSRKATRIARGMSLESPCRPLSHVDDSWRRRRRGSLSVTVVSGRNGTAGCSPTSFVASNSIRIAVAVSDQFAGARRKS
jgi:hypothetical protein